MIQETKTYTYSSEIIRYQQDVARFGHVQEWTLSDFKCLAIRRTSRTGSLWCGYVRLPVGHKLHGVTEPEFMDGLHVHGGWTFAHPLHTGEWIIGFDCWHGGLDFTFKKDDDTPFRDLEYVKKELERVCKHLTAGKGEVAREEKEEEEKEKLKPLTDKWLKGEPKCAYLEPETVDTDFPCCTANVEPNQIFCAQHAVDSKAS
jgi:hypothetical protein